MEQRGPAQVRLPGRMGQGVEGVLPHIVTMERGFLGTALHRRQLRQDGEHHFGILPQDCFRIFPAEELCQLFPDTLLGQGQQQPSPFPQSSGRGRLYGKSQLGGKPQAPEDAQGVLGKAADRFPHTAEDALLQVFPALEQIHQPPPGVVRHGINGEIPACQVIFQAAGKGNGIGVAGIAVGAIGPVGGDLDGVTVFRNQGNGTVGRADLHQPRPGKTGFCFLWPGVGGHVPVKRGFAQKGIPHTAPHAPGFIPGLFQAGQGFPHRCWGLDGQVHGDPPLGICCFTQSIP